QPVVRAPDLGAHLGQRARQLGLARAHHRLGKGDAPAALAAQLDGLAGRERLVRRFLRLLVSEVGVGTLLRHVDARLVDGAAEPGGGDRTVVGGGEREGFVEAEGWLCRLGSRGRGGRRWLLRGRSGGGRRWQHYKDEYS